MILLTLTACHRTHHFTPDKASLRVLETDRQGVKGRGGGEGGKEESEEARQSEEKEQRDSRQLPIAWRINKPREKQLDVSFSRGGGLDMTRTARRESTPSAQSVEILSREVS